MPITPGWFCLGRRCGIECDLFRNRPHYSKRGRWLQGGKLRAELLRTITCSFPNIFFQSPQKFCGHFEHWEWQGDVSAFWSFWLGWFHPLLDQLLALLFPVLVNMRPALEYYERVWQSLCQWGAIAFLSSKNGAPTLIQHQVLRAQTFTVAIIVTVAINLSHREILGN